MLQTQPAPVGERGGPEPSVLCGADGRLLPVCLCGGTVNDRATVRALSWPILGVLCSYSDMAEGSLLRLLAPGEAGDGVPPFCPGGRTGGRAERTPGRSSADCAQKRPGNQTLGRERLPRPRLQS